MFISDAVKKNSIEGLGIDFNGKKNGEYASLFRRGKTVVHTEPYFLRQIVRD